MIIFKVADSIVISRLKIANQSLKGSFDVGIVYKITIALFILPLILIKLSVV